MSGTEEFLLGMVAYMLRTTVVPFPFWVGALLLASAALLLFGSSRVSAQVRPWAITAFAVSALLGYSTVNLLYAHWFAPPPPGRQLPIVSVPSAGCRFSLPNFIERVPPHSAVYAYDTFYVWLQRKQVIPEVTRSQISPDAIGFVLLNPYDMPPSLVNSIRSSLRDGKPGVLLIPDDPAGVEAFNRTAESLGMMMRAASAEDSIQLVGGIEYHLKPQGLTAAVERVEKSLLLVVVGSELFSRLHMGGIENPPVPERMEIYNAVYALVDFLEESARANHPNE